MIVVKKPNWQRVVWVKGKITARLQCPKCGIWALLNHDILADGTVKPSVVCGTDCGFHEMVKLEVWKG